MVAASYGQTMKLEKENNIITLYSLPKVTLPFVFLLPSLMAAAGYGPVKSTADYPDWRTCPPVIDRRSRISLISAN